MNNLFDVQGKVVVITGGSRGLGYAMAKAFGEGGADLVIASRKLDACETVCEELQKSFGVKALPVLYHAGKWDNHEALINKVLDAFGHIDVLINNAGASPLFGDLTEVGEEMWNKVMNLNLTGPFRLSALAAEAMKARGGSIIYISSVGAMEPSKHELPYAIAKSGLHTLSSGLSNTYAGSVRFNVIMPGAFLTDISKAWDEKMHDHIRASVPMGRAGNPDEIIGAALYLSSDAASYTTGAVIKVDGGVCNRAG